MAVVDRLTSIDKLKEQIKRLQQELALERTLRERSDREVMRLAPIVEAVLNAQLGRINENLVELRRDVERNGSTTMADIQHLSDAIDAQGQVIQQEAQEVKAQLDQMNATIADLRNQVAPDVQPLVDKLSANTAAVAAIFSSEPTPTPEPGPEPAPGQRRR